MCFRPATADSSLSKQCPECDATNGMLDAVCTQCGAKLPASGPGMSGAQGVPGAPAAPGAPGMPATPGAPAMPKAPGVPGRN